MLCNILRSEDDFGGASCKWFFVAFFLKYGSDYGVKCSIDSLATELGFSKDLTSKSVNKLVKLGFLSKEQNRSGQGRPIGIYSVTKRVLNLEGNDGDLDCASMVAAILSLEKGHLDVKGVRFDGGAKLLFSVLLCHSNRHGVVKDVGSSLLCKQAGMSIEQFRKQIDKLIFFGLIRSVVKGCTGQYLFGRVDNYYFLNLHSDVFKGELSPGVRVVFSLQGEHFFSDSYAVKRFSSDLVKADRGDRVQRGLTRVTAVERLFGAALNGLLRVELDFISKAPKEGRSVDQIAGVHYLPISSWRSGLRTGFAPHTYRWLASERNAMFARLQLLIDEGAGILLSEGWKCFSRTKADPDMACAAELAVYQKFKKELFSPKVRHGETCGPPITEGQRDDLVCFFFLMARQSARRIHGFLVDTELDNPTDYSYVILPLPRPYETRHGWVLEAVPKAGKAVPSAELLFDLKHGVKVVKSATPSIAVMPQKELIKLGLRSGSKCSG